MRFFLGIFAATTFFSSIYFLYDAQAENRLIIDTSRLYQEIIEDGVNAVLPCAEISVTQGRKSVWTVFKENEQSKKVYIDFDNSVTAGKPIVIECKKPINISPPDAPIIDEPTPEPSPTAGLYNRKFSWQAPTKRVENDQEEHPIVVKEYTLLINGSRFIIPASELFYEIQLPAGSYSVAITATDSFGLTSTTSEINFVILQE